VGLSDKISVVAALRRWLRLAVAVCVGAGVPAFAGAARAEPVLSDPIPISHRPWAAAYHHQYDPAIAAGSNGFLIVWIDMRDSASSPMVWGMLLDRDGVPTKPIGIRVSAITNGSPRDLRVSWDGQNYLVVWADSFVVQGDRITGGGGLRYLIGGRRVSPDGALLEGPTEGIGISLGGAVSVEHPTVAFNGTHHFVIWQDQRNGDYDLYGARVDPGGRLLDPDGVAVIRAAGRQTSPALSWNGAQYLLAWADNRANAATSFIKDVFAARLGADGVSADGTGFVVSNEAADQDLVATGWDGASHLVTWRQIDPAIGPLWQAGVRGRRVAADGRVLDAADLVFLAPDATVDTDIEGPVVGSAGNGHVVMWTQIGSSAGDISSSFLGPSDAAPTAPTRLLTTRVTSPRQRPVLLGTGGRMFAAWPELVDGGMYDVIGGELSPSGQWPAAGPSTRMLSLTLHSQDNPAVAWAGDRYIAVWQDQRHGVDAIFGARIGADGVVQDAEGLRISRSGQRAFFPAVAHAEGRALVAWLDHQAGATADLVAARVTDQGVVEDPTARTIIGGVNERTRPKLASNGRDFLVMWNSSDLGAGYAVVAADGTVAPPVSVATSDVIWNLGIGAAWDGQAYMLVWGEHSAAGWGLRARRVAPTTAPATPNPIDLCPCDIGGALATMDGTLEKTQLAIAWNGEIFLVVWADGRVSESNIRGVRLLPDGRVLDPPGISIASGTLPEWQPAVAWDGDSFVVEWADGRAGTSLPGLMVARVGADGSVRPERTEIVAATQLTSAAQVASGGDGRSLLSFTLPHPDSALPTFADRAWARLFSSGLGVGQPCTAHAACGSGVCSPAGVCARPTVDRSAAVASRPIGCPTGTPGDAGQSDDAAGDAPGDGGVPRTGGGGGCSCTVGTGDAPGVIWVLLLCVAVRRIARRAAISR
jgi:hypothetical protein